MTAAATTHLGPALATGNHPDVAIPPLPMGRVHKLLAAPGRTMKAGDVLAVLEEN